MRFFIPAILAFSSMLRAETEQAIQSFPGCRLVPVDWADGDSFQVRLPDGREETVRIYGADCIELHVNNENDARRLCAQRRYFGIAGDAPEASISEAKKFGAAAAVRTGALLAEPFTVHTTFADGWGDSRFHRIYAFVTTSAGDDLASVLVKEGLARAYGVAHTMPDGTSAREYRQHLQDLELTSASSRLGIWSKTDWSRLPEDRHAERLEEEEISSSLTKKPPLSGVDPNTASRDELMLLPGIGEVLANRIIEGREGGAYSSPRDLLRVRRLSPKTIDAIAPALRFTKPASGGGESPRP